MDNAIFDGTWIELDVRPCNAFTERIDIWNLEFDHIKDQLDFSHFPEKEFYCFPISGSNNIAFLHMKSGNYECPIDKYDDHIKPYYEQLFKNPIEREPLEQEVEIIKNTKLYEYLIKQYRENKVTVKAGKFMCVS